MKQRLIKCLPLAAALLIAGNVQAQESTSMSSGTQMPLTTWSIGVNGGVLTPISPLGGKNDFSNWKSNFGYGLYIKKQFTPYFSLRLDGVRGKLSGDNSKPFISGLTPASAVNRFETDLTYSGSLNAVINLFNIDMFKKEDNVQLYASAGAGLAGYQVKTAPTAGGTLVDYAGGKTISELIIPIGLGAKFRVSDKINLDLGWTVNYVDGDNLDGVYREGNDKYSYGYAGLEFALGTGKQKAWHNPVALTYDEALAARQTANALKGELDATKAENARLRTDMNDILKDTDGDGVADKLDKCPDTPAGTVVDGSGCPLKVPVAVIQEKVIITEADRKVVADAIKNLEFDLGKSTIRSKSYGTLNRVAALLIQKNFSLKLAGHTDNTGSNALNMRLSKDRAEAIRSYLVSQGANASRIEATGYGEEQPISSNKSAAGRQNNRRVEFTLF
ncbi:OmpA family protein [Pedobacter sp. JCM 36344]|uniref:OmpA family protein n=1 Tax=Pedobacter sp. JCM 36344 TaxID=3374280 RepID=UPI00397B8C7F